MAKRKQEEASGGLPGWMATYGDLVTLLLCFFVLLFAMSSIDVAKFKAAVSSFKDQIDIMPGGVALTGEELITNGVSQLGEIEVILEQNHLNEDSIQEKTNEDAATTEQATQEKTESQSSANSGNVESKTEEIAKEIQKYLTKEGIESKVILSYNSNYVKMTIEGEVLFDVGKAAIKPDAKTLVDKISKMILEKKYDTYNIQVDGHTDDWDINTPQYPNNWYLSAARAIAVGEILINQYKFNPDSIACTGYGEFNPIADNNTAEGRAKNRRVEIKLILETEEVKPDTYF